MENIDFQKANKKRLEVLQKGYNANTKVIEKYLDKLQDLLSEMSDDEDVQLIDLYRVLSVTIARITTATLKTATLTLSNGCANSPRTSGRATCVPSWAVCSSPGMMFTNR